MVAFWPVVTLQILPLPGIAVGIFLLLLAELCEAGYLYRQRGKLLESRGLVPLDAKVVEYRDGTT